MLRCLNVVLIAFATILSACQPTNLHDSGSESNTAVLSIPTTDINTGSDAQQIGSGQISGNTIESGVIFDTFIIDIIYQPVQIDKTTEPVELPTQIIVDEPEKTEDENQRIVKVEQNNKFFPIAENSSVVRKRSNIRFCEKIDNKLHSVSFRSCLIPELHDSLYNSHHGQPIFYTDFATVESETNLGKVLLLGGVHGDELTSVSSVFNWINKLYDQNSGLFSWRIVPLVNPDGFFLFKSSRTNGAGVDLNRNLPTKNWNDLASRYWYEKANAVPRKFPGLRAASEPETRWLIDEIEKYKPDVIVSVHAPYNLVDYDAVNRSNAPRRLGILEGKSLGTFPGSLGRYAGEQRNIPVITIELPHSTKMPTNEEIRRIWVDLEEWLRTNIRNRRSTANI